MAKDKQRTYEQVKQDAQSANEQAKGSISKTQRTLQQEETIVESIRRDRREKRG